MGDVRWRMVRGEPADRRLAPDLLVAGVAFCVLLAAVVAGWGPVERVDDATVDALNDVVADAGVAATVLRYVTDLGGAQVAWLLVPLVVVWLLIRRAPRAAAFAAATGLGAAVLDPAVKALVDRARPMIDVTVATAPGPSFPSGHALGSTVTYGLLLLVLLPVVPARHRRAVVAAVVGLVAVVGFTRVALGVHHPSDVVAGWALGVLWLGVSDVAFLHPRHALPVAPEQAGEDADPSHPAPRGGELVPEGYRSAAMLAVAAVLIWGALLLLGELLSDPSGVVLRLDAVIIDAAVSIRGEALSDAAALVGRLGGRAGVVVGVVVTTVLALAVTRRWRPGLFVLAAVVGETAIFLASVTIVDRGRPQVEALTGNLPPTPSFPSGHAAAATALYGAIAMLVWAWGPRWAGRLAVVVAGAVAVGVALSRLYTRVHYPTDVLASILYTIVWLLVCWRVLRPGPGEGDPSARATDRQAREARIHGHV